MLNVPEERIGQVAKGANLLQFKDGKMGIDPYCCVFWSKLRMRLASILPRPKRELNSSS